MTYFIFRVVLWYLPVSPWSRSYTFAWWLVYDWIGGVTMPRKASPLSSLFIGNFTWSYIFIHHMICVLLGASISFVSFYFILVRIMFCIFSFNKKVKDSLCHAYFASIHVAVWKTESLPLLQKFPRKVREWYNVEYFCILRSDKFITVGILVQNFWS